jgi:hypothetical protein
MQTGAGGGGEASCGPPLSTTCGRVFSHVRPSYVRAVSDLDRSINIFLWF